MANMPREAITNGPNTETTPAMPVATPRYAVGLLKDAHSHDQADQKDASAGTRIV